MPTEASTNVQSAGPYTSSASSSDLNQQRCPNRCLTRSLFSINPTDTAYAQSTGDAAAGMSGQQISLTDSEAPPLGSLACRLTMIQAKRSGRRAPVESGSFVSSTLAQVARTRPQRQAADSATHLSSDNYRLYGPDLGLPTLRFPSQNAEARGIVLASSCRKLPQLDSIEKPLRRRTQWPMPL